jgi:hypothetical protein
VVEQACCWRAAETFHGLVFAFHKRISDYLNKLSINGADRPRLEVGLPPARWPATGASWRHAEEHITDLWEFCKNSKIKRKLFPRENALWREACFNCDLRPSKTGADGPFNRLPATLPALSFC